MDSINKAAIIWSILIVFVAVEIAMFGNASDVSHHNSKINPVNSDELGKQVSMISPIHIQTNKEVYNTNDVIMISGYVDRVLDNIAMTVVISDPLENIVTIAQIEVANDKTFVEYFKIGGSLWKQNGFYTVTVHYGEKNVSETTFTFLSDLDPDGLL